MGGHANSSTLKEEADKSLGVQGQPGLYWETLSLKQKRKWVGMQHLGKELDPCIQSQDLEAGGIQKEDFGVAQWWALVKHV